MGGGRGKSVELAEVLFSASITSSVAASASGKPARFLRHSTCIQSYEPAAETERDPDADPVERRHADGRTFLPGQRPVLDRKKCAVSPIISATR